MAKTAVVLLNLGGPDRPEAVRPFLFNLFNDPAILGVPAPLRWLLARAMSAWRMRKAREIYDRLGGGSPLLANTERQAGALAEALADLGDVRVFIAMRYWHPMSDETAARVKDFGPEDIVLLPLYPQYSTTTTASSIREWRRAARRAGLTAPTRTVCCYPTEPGFVGALAALVRRGIRDAGRGGKPRVLFSAHGLPKRVVARGDPYQWQAETTAKAVVSALAIEDLDWVVCYQSRIGPLAWIGPATGEEVARAAADGVPVVMVPIAFVSEHSETLVELDVEYARQARELGVPLYVRVPAVGTDAGFIEGLASLARRARGADAALCSGEGGRLCPAACRRCAYAVSLD